MLVIEVIFNLFLALNTAFICFVLGIITLGLTLYAVGRMCDNQIRIIPRIITTLLLVVTMLWGASLTYYCGTLTLGFYQQASQGLTFRR